VIAYRRTDPGEEGGDLFVAVPRLFAGIVGEATWSGEAFAGTRVDLGAGTSWRDIVSGRTVEGTGEGVDLGDLLRDLPYVVLRRAS
jgi:(1->4)-alpha-D-glucan 1-alpha-D-glucosylmutase